jgi:uncharacterized protein (TIGR00297 family)
VSVYSEDRRQLVHISMVGFAALLRYITWPQAAALAVGALAFNLFVLPRVAPSILRATDSGGHRAGVIFYPLSVLILVLVFRSRLDIAAAAWAVMAFGDGAATLAGTRIGGPRLPWNPEKTWSGLLGFIIASSIGAVTLSVWVAPSIEPPIPPTFTWWAPMAASLVAAFVETIPVRLDDNLSVPIAAGLVLLLAALVDQPAVEHAWPVLASRLPIAIGLNLVMATAAWMIGSVSSSGALAGALIGAIVYAGAGLPGWVMLLTTFVAAVGASKLGRRRQIARGIAEDRAGRRGAGNVLANCLVGAIGAWMMTVDTADASGALILAAGLTAGASDTVASEIGKAFGSSPRAFPSFRHVPPGTPGAVSPIGTVAGFMAAVLMAMLAAAILPGGEMLVPGVVVGATVGAFVESSLATRFEPDGVLNNDLLNFINTSVAALVAVATTAGALQLLDRV